MRLPASVQEIADVIGREAALYLIGKLPRCFTGNPGHQSWRVIMYVPKAIKPNHPLVTILGWRDAVRLADAFGGEILQPASCAGIYRRFRDRSIVRMVEAGAGHAQVAELMGVSERHVRNLAREKTQEARQGERPHDARELKQFRATASHG